MHFDAWRFCVHAAILDQTFLGALPRPLLKGTRFRNSELCHGYGSVAAPGNTQDECKVGKPSLETESCQERVPCQATSSGTFSSSMILDRQEKQGLPNSRNIDGAVGVKPECRRVA